MNAPPERPPLSPALALTFGVLAASTSSIFIRFAQGDGSSLAIAAYRLALATLLLAPFVLRRFWGEFQSLTRRERIFGLISGLLLALHFATWITSLEYTTVASSVVLVTTTPLWVALLAPLTLRETISRLAFAGILVALVGGVVVGLSDSCTLSASGLVCPPLSDFIRGPAFLGDLLALAGAWAAAGYLLVGRSLRRKMSLLPYIFLVYGAAAVVLVIIMFASAAPAFGYSPDFYLWVLLLALFPQLLGHTSYNWALRYFPAAFVSIAMLGEPISSTLLALAFLNETPGLLKLFGAILILAGIYTVSRTQTTRPPRPETVNPLN